MAVPSLIGVVVTFVVLELVAAVTDSLSIKNWIMAIIAAIAMVSVNRLVAFLLPDMPAVGPWQVAALMFLFNVVALAVTAMVVPGMATRGVQGLLLAAALLTVAAFFVPQLLVKAGMPLYQFPGLSHF